MGQCARSGRWMMLKDMVRDGRYPNLMVDPDWYEGVHPQERLIPMDDPVALRRPSPINDLQPLTISVIDLIDNESGVFNIVFGLNGGPTITAQTTIPDAFTFNDVINASLNTDYISNEITITGINTVVPISVTGAQYSKNNAAYTSSAGVASGGDKFRLKLNSGPSGNATVSGVFNVNGVSDSFDVSTISTCDSSFDADRLLLHFNGTNGSTTFTDNTYLRSWTPFGNAQISTAQSVFGGASGLFDGTGDYISTPDDVSLDTTNTTTDKTIEVRFYSRNVSAAKCIAAKCQAAGANNTGWRLEQNASSKIVFTVGNGTGTNVAVLTSTSSVVINTWTAVAVTRSGTTWRLFINGTLEASSGQSGAAPTANTDLLLIGRDSRTALQPSNDWDGYLDEFRFTNGVARYTATYTVSATEFEDTLCTANFHTTARDFDGAGRTSLSNTTAMSPSSVGVLSLWVNFHSGFDGVDQSPCGVLTSISSFGMMNLQRNASTKKISFQLKSSAATTVLSFTTVETIPNSVWTHIAIAWDTTTASHTCYINGVAATLTGVVTAAGSVNWALGTVPQLCFGAFTDTVNTLHGCMSEFFFDTQAYIDLTVAANLERFYISSSGKPAYIGNQIGQMPLHFRPFYYCRNGELNSNLGLSGGGASHAPACADSPLA